MKYTIEKTFDGFDVGHRVCNQDLDFCFTDVGNREPKCLRFHGHSAKIKVKLGSDQLIKHGVVVDYNEIGFVKDLIRQLFDHRTMIWSNDPIFKEIYLPLAEKSKLVLFDTEYCTQNFKAQKFKLDDVEDYVKDLFNSFTVLSFTSTSENISKWLFEVVKTKILDYNKLNNTNVKVLSVSYLETDHSEATYSEE